jgi:cytochrome c oxidase subunit 2
MVVLRSHSAGLGLLIALLAAWPTAGSGVAVSPQPEKPIDVMAERFAFTPSEIKAKVNTPLVLQLRSDDTDHSFKLEGTDIDVRIPKRGKGAATVTFEPVREGRYTFECSHVCGAGHAFMRGVIIVSK